jgi:hypothetical protein
MYVASSNERSAAMKMQVTLTRTDSGATTKVTTSNGEARKDYLSWGDALMDGEHLGLLNTVESLAAQALPPGLPLHTKADVNLSKLSDSGFISGKTPPPQ